MFHPTSLHFRKIPTLQDGSLAQNILRNVLEFNFPPNVKIIIIMQNIKFSLDFEWAFPAVPHNHRTKWSSASQKRPKQLQGDSGNKVYTI